MKLSKPSAPGMAALPTALRAVLPTALLAVLLTVLLAACGTASAAGPHNASLPGDGHSHATLQVVTGTTQLKVGVADLGAGGPLLRVSTPAADPPPQLRESGDNPVISLSASGASAVTVTLNAHVSWQLDLAGGTTRTVADLRGGRLAGITVTAGSDVLDLVLPRPRGAVPVRLAAGASQLLLSLPRGVPARVTAAGGAGEILLEGQDHVGVAGGSVFTTPDWTASAARFDIDAIAGAALVSVTAREYRLTPEPPASGGESAAAADGELDEYMHLYMLNRGILMTPFHNMALMSPATTKADVAAHADAFAAAVTELLGG
jgi:hypothetical protein